MIERHSHSGLGGDGEKINNDNLLNGLSKTHTHSGGDDGEQIEYSDILNAPVGGVSVYARYNISSETIGGGSVDRVVPLTLNESSGSGDFTLATNKITIKNAGWYTISSSVRYDNLSSGLEILVYSYKNTSGGTFYAATQTYFDTSNDYVTLTTVKKFAANDTLQIIALNHASSSVDLEPISTLNIVQL